jgi:hypothetical protein
LVLESAIDDPEVIVGKVLCDSKLCPAGCSITECLDFYFKFFWVFNLQYPAGLNIFFQFLESKVFKLPSGQKTIPSTITEVGNLFGLV